MWWSRRVWKQLVVVATVACLGLFSPSEAKACLCEEGVVLLPLGQTRSVDDTESIMGPRGPILFVDLFGQLGADAFRLTGADGAAVPTEASSMSLTVSANRIWVFRPTEPLTVGESYQYAIEGFIRSHAGSVVVVEPSETLPQPPSVSSVEYGESHGSSCGDYAWASVALERDRGIVLADVAASSSFDEATLSGTVSYAGTGDGASIGTYPCSSPSWREIGPGASTTVRFGLLDIDGRFSGWGEPVPLDYPERDAPSGCALSLARSTPGRYGWAMLLLLAAGAAAGRRHPR